MADGHGFGNGPNGILDMAVLYIVLSLAILLVIGLVSVVPANQ